MDDINRPPALPDLAADFPPPSWEEWKKAVEETLKGVPFEKAMITKTYEGIDLQPIYRKEDTAGLAHLNALPGQAPFVRGNNAEGYLLKGWKIAQAQTDWNPAAANKTLLNELNRGLNSVNLKLDKYTRWATLPALDNLNPDGIWLSTLEDLETLFKDVDLQAAPLMADGGEASLALLGLVKAWLDKNDLPAAALTGFIGFDLIASLVEDGELPFSEEDKWQTYYQMSKWAVVEAPALRTILLDGSFWGNRGADSMLELAYAIATANEYIKALLDKGLHIEEIAPRFQLNLTLGSNLFMEIAKVRAARLLWAELLKAYDAPAELQTIWIHGITSTFNKTVYDPYVNVLRTATESFSGVIGGIDSLEVLPFDCRIKPDDEFSRHIARNQQIILEEEVHLNKVIDPAGGCYYIEVLTSQLAEKAWQKMQQIESRGGMYKAIQDGTSQSEVSAIAMTRKQNVDKRKDVMVGLNMFANNLEQPLEQPEHVCRCAMQDRFEQIMAVQDSSRPGLETALQELELHRFDERSVELAAACFLLDATMEEVFDRMITPEASLEAEMLPLCHVTDDLENLRTKVVNHQQKNETVLSVFLANMGPIAQYKARADFALGFLQVGGFYVANNDGFTSVDEAVEAAVFSKAQAVCICSTDDTYPELVPQIIQKAKAAKPEMIFILAGFPQEMVETYKSQGIDFFIHIRANVYETLTDLANLMGVKA